MGATNVLAAIAQIQTTPQTDLTFTPTRYPYTYASDYMKKHWLKLLPVGIRTLYTDDELSGSRGIASQARQFWAEAEGVEDEWLARQLADAYLKQEGIPNPKIAAGEELDDQQLQLNIRDLIAHWRKYGTRYYRDAAQQLEDVLAGVPVPDAAHRSSVIGLHRY